MTENEQEAPPRVVPVLNLSHHRGYPSIQTAGDEEVRYVCKAELLVLPAECRLRLTILPLGEETLRDVVLPSGFHLLKAEVPVFVEVVLGQNETVEQRILDEATRAAESSARLARHLGAS